MSNKVIQAKLKKMQKAEARLKALIASAEEAAKQKSYNQDKAKLWENRIAYAEQEHDMAYAEYYNTVHAEYSEEEIALAMFGSEGNKLLRPFDSQKFINRLEAKKLKK